MTISLNKDVLKEIFRRGDTHWDLINYSKVSKSWKEALDEEIWHLFAKKINLEIPEGLSSERMIKNKCCIVSTKKEFEDITRTLTKQLLPGDSLTVNYVADYRFSVEEPYSCLNQITLLSISRISTNQGKQLFKTITSSKVLDMDLWMVAIGIKEDPPKYTYGDHFEHIGHNFCTLFTSHDTPFKNRWTKLGCSLKHLFSLFEKPMYTAETALLK